MIVHVVVVSFETKNIDDSWCKTHIKPEFYVQCFLGSFLFNFRTVFQLEVVSHKYPWMLGRLAWSGGGVQPLPPLPPKNLEQRST